MRTTINISFPNDLYVFIRERTEDGAYASTSEYIRALVREDRLRNGGKQRPQRKKWSAPRKVNDIMAGMPERQSEW
jgi:Arc/MetJ-type ribon-helix-helix transcriptional regulator